MEIKSAPLHIFRKRLKSIAVVQQISHDLDRPEVSAVELKRFYLNQSYIVYLVASWQVFIENLGQFSFDELDRYRNRKNLNIDISQEEKFEKIRKHFSTPNARGISDFIAKATGKTNVMGECKWGSHSSAWVNRRLGDILSIRHEVAHETVSREELSTEINWDHAKFLYNCACVLNNILNQHIHQHTGRTPYIEAEVKYKDI